VPGPGPDFFGAVEKALGGLPFVAEDLGTITPDVGALRDAFHIPGTRVLQFAFDGHADNRTCRELRPQHGRLHRHSRQPADPKLV
jgi:4-alpha-glucanotransferase